MIILHKNIRHYLLFCTIFASFFFLRQKQQGHVRQFLAMDAFTRHRKLVNDYLRYYGGKIEDFQRSSANDKTDHDVIQEHHQFVWEDDEGSGSSWGKSLAKKYYDKLFKEYCISDLSRYKENKFAMRWRTEKEVMEGKGQFTCGGRKCAEKEGLQSWEVNFGYVEHGVKKNALVKLRLCSNCSDKLNFHQKRKLAGRKEKVNETVNKERKRKRDKKNKKDKKNAKKKRRRDSSSSNDDSSETDEDPKEKPDQKEDETDTSPKETDNTSAIWSQQVEQVVEKSRDEELEAYLDDLFL
eukprot:Seg2012.3 transcript_id=Seg2012.3/GoldUCD/mRNA.D3Y31 product="Protein FRA10AC1-like" protein_id=Seg2012.3/GoldUCD/D3Y31